MRWRTANRFAASLHVGVGGGSYVEKDDVRRLVGRGVQIGRIAERGLFDLIFMGDNLYADPTAHPSYTVRLEPLTMLAATSAGISWRAVGVWVTTDLNWLKNSVTPRVENNCCISGVRGAAVAEPRTDSAEFAIDRVGRSEQLARRLAAQHVLLALRGTFRVRDRVVARGGLRQAGDFISCGRDCVVQPAGGRWCHRGDLSADLVADPPQRRRRPHLRRPQPDRRVRGRPGR